MTANSGPKWPEYHKCPIHGMKASKASVGGCNCYEVEIINRAYDRCKASFKVWNKATP